MKVKPMHDWAVIVPAEAEARTAGGLFIPDSAKEKPKEGVVEAIGPGAYEEEKQGKKKDPAAERTFIPTVVKPGDRVLYETWAGQTFTIGQDERVLVRERNILGLIDRPLIPSVTTHTGTTALAGYFAAPPAKKAQTALMKTPVQAKKKPKAKPAKKTAKKPAARKKASKKTAKKAVKKKPAAKTGKTRTAKGGKARKKK